MTTPVFCQHFSIDLTSCFVLDKMKIVGVVPFPDWAIFENAG